MHDEAITIDAWVEDQIRSMIAFRDHWKVMKNNDSALLGQALRPIDWMELREAFEAAGEACV